MPKITLTNSNDVITWRTKDAPFHGLGRPGSVLDVLLHHGFEMGHYCGGQLSCGTCHIVVHSGFDDASPISAHEQDWLDLIDEAQPTSRLACQCVFEGAVEAVIEIPTE